METEGFINLSKSLETVWNKYYNEKQCRKKNSIKKKFKKKYMDCVKKLHLNEIDKLQKIFELNNKYNKKVFDKKYDLHC